MRNSMLAAVPAMVFSYVGQAFRVVRKQPQETDDNNGGNNNNNGEGTEPVATLGTCGTKGGEDSSFTPIISIVNGNNAEACEWRWQVGFRGNGTQGVPWCGGMLISPEWVLTAAHCLEGEQPWQLEVLAGEYSISNASGHEQVRKVDKIIMHPYYDAEETRFDFGLVHLAEPVTMSECVGTVCLPSLDEEVVPGTKCWVTGWGTLETEGDQPDILQEAAVTILSNRDCKYKFDYEPDMITQEMICHQGITVNDNGDITDSCQGDSGGPLVCETTPGQWTLHGATSWGFDCADKTAPGVSARVTEVLEWIAEVQAGDSGFIPSEHPTPAPPPSCPGQALRDSPDGNSNCMCAPHKFCSRDGGESYDCPVFRKRGKWFNPLKLDPFERQLFEFDCTDCACYPFKPTLPKLPSFFR